MKLEMSEFGVIRIVPETSLEAYALKKWSTETWISHKDETRLESGHWRGSKLIIVLETPNEKVNSAGGALSASPATERSES